MIVAALDWTHVPLFVQTFGNTVAVVLVVLSLRVAVAQSYVTVSGQLTLYQKVSDPPAAGEVNVCTIVLSPFVAATPPTREVNVPL